MEAENIENDTRECAEGFDMNVEEKHNREVEVEEGGGMVKVMEEVVKEQMGVIRELTERVKDLEKKLLKNNNNNKRMKKVNNKKKKRRRFDGCIVEEELS
ncbi:hypothetical protein L6452_33249 [Arctium lappa]|uniref:Uncharacterized protein n=1 Tax=Arctium lappa TaxID=4217 RepID=A0ACB8Z828_ARCLA|nr:hypothetical protein L6452_33249 [Arctium lappa]